MQQHHATLFAPGRAKRTELRPINIVVHWSSAPCSAGTRTLVAASPALSLDLEIGHSTARNQLDECTLHCNSEHLSSGCRSLVGV